MNNSYFGEDLGPGQFITGTGCRTFLENYWSPLLPFYLIAAEGGAGGGRGITGINYAVNGLDHYFSLLSKP